MSSTDLAIGPGEGKILSKTFFLGKLLKCPLMLSLLSVGLIVYIPQNPAGDLKLPPMSDPILKGTHLAATKPASPPELPPGVLNTS